MQTMLAVKYSTVHLLVGHLLQLKVLLGFSSINMNLYPLKFTTKVKTNKSFIPNLHKLSEQIRVGRVFLPNSQMKS